MLFSIITPTTGNLKLEKLLESINGHVLGDDIKIEHLIVCDGPKFSEKVNKICGLTPPVSNKDKTDVRKVSLLKNLVKNIMQLNQISLKIIITKIL